MKTLLDILALLIVIPMAIAAAVMAAPFITMLGVILAFVWLIDWAWERIKRLLLI